MKTIKVKWAVMALMVWVATFMLLPAIADPGGGVLTPVQQDGAITGTDCTVSVSSTSFPVNTKNDQFEAAFSQNCLTTTALALAFGNYHNNWITVATTMDVANSITQAKFDVTTNGAATTAFTCDQNTTYGETASILNIGGALALENVTASVYSNLFAGNETRGRGLIALNDRACLRTEQLMAGLTLVPRAT